jgi:hypothetical protein
LSLGKCKCFLFKQLLSFLKVSSSISKQSITMTSAVETHPFGHGLSVDSGVVGQGLSMFAAHVGREVGAVASRERAAGKDSKNVFLRL